MNHREALIAVLKARRRREREDRWLTAEAWLIGLVMLAVPAIGLFG